MSPNRLWEHFCIFFPIYSKSTEVWFINNQNSIRIRIPKLRSEFIFTYKNEKEWKLETLKNYKKDA